MLDDLVELILELVLDGAAQAVESKSVPRGVRIFLLVVIITVILGVCIFLIGAGISNDKIALIILGAVLFVVFAALIAYEIWQHRNGRES